MPITHASLTVSHLPTATSFFSEALWPLGYKFKGAWGSQIGFGTEKDPDFFIQQGSGNFRAGDGHVAFHANNKSIVYEFYTAAIKAGGRSYITPDESEHSDECFSAAVLDLDGNSIEAVWHPHSHPHRHQHLEDTRSMAPSRVLLLENGDADDTRTIVSVRSGARSISGESMYSATRSVSHRSLALQACSTHAPSVVSRAPSQLSRAPTQMSQATQVSASTVLSTLQKSMAGGEGSEPSLLSAAASLLSASKAEMSPKAFAGTLLGAAAGAAVAYAMCKSEEDSAHAEAEASLAAAYRRLSMQDSPMILPAPSNSPAQSIYSQMSRRTGVRQIETGHLREIDPFEFRMPDRNYAPTPPLSTVSAAKTQASSRSARRISPSMLDDQTVQSQMYDYAPPQYSNKSRTSSRAPSHASSYVPSNHTARETSYSPASHHNTKETSYASASHHTAREASYAPASHSNSYVPTNHTSRGPSKPTSKAQSPAASVVESRTSERSKRSSSISKKSSKSHPSRSKAPSVSLSRVPEDYILPEHDNDDDDDDGDIDRETVAPSDSISCVGERRSPKSRTSSRSSKKSQSRSGRSRSQDRPSRSGAERSARRAATEVYSVASDATMTPKNYKERSVLSMPIR